MWVFTCLYIIYSFFYIHTMTYYHCLCVVIVLFYVNVIVVTYTCSFF